MATAHRGTRNTCFLPTDPNPGPGSEVMVPVKDLANPTNYVALVSAIAQILASTVRIIVVARICESRQVSSMQRASVCESGRLHCDVISVAGSQAEGHFVSR